MAATASSRRGRYNVLSGQVFRKGLRSMRNSLLKSIFGHDAFRPGQEELIDALAQGRDLLGVMATGSGKSLCYQFPAVEKTGRCLVISPLISLMNDQVKKLEL